ncbi:basic proline-rich protein-like [Ursus americanus]|uniref:basic proline-rich protein-like n=1 Tax=Ursus americanus TaxID=9643 RepID=UPI001E67B507|nr:basic proline-rich protein-like [Ursus americanus]
MLNSLELKSCLKHWREAGVPIAVLEGVKRTARRPERCQGPSFGRQRPAGEAPRRRGAAPARPCAPNRPEELRAPPSAAQVRARGPPGSPPARRGRRRPDPPPSRFPPNLGTARPGTKGEGTQGAAAGRWSDAPPGSAGSLGSSPSRPPCRTLPVTPVPRVPPPGPSSSLPTSSPAPPPRPHPDPTPCPLLSQPRGRPSPGGVFPRSRLLRRASARPAGRRLMCPASPSPSPSPPPAPLLQLSPPPPSPQSPAETEAAPAAASRSRRPDPRGGACALRAAVGAGASRRGLGAGGARHVALGWEGAPRSVRAAARAPNFLRSGPRALPGGPGGAERVGATSVESGPGWARTSPRDSSFLRLGSRDSSPPRPVPHFGRATNGAVRTRLT